MSHGKRIHQQLTAQSASKRKVFGEILRDRANTLSQAIFDLATPSKKSEHPTMSRSISSKSLISRSKSRSTRKTSRGYFGSPHARFTSTNQLWSDSLGDDRDAVLKSIPAKELKRREVRINCLVIVILYDKMVRR